MTKSITIEAERKYEVVLVDDWATELLNSARGRRVVLLVPEKLASFVLTKLPGAELIVLPEGEAQKSISTFAEVLEKLADLLITRSDLIVGIGGGATTDLAGFVAATYLRGIEWIAVPTSVVGALDASIGGKTGINLDHGKNLAGAFHSPSRVIVDFGWLSTLDDRDIRAGLVEAVKCGFIADPTILDLMRDYQANIEAIIERSIQVKASIVGKDFRESNIREFLNYGHTLGHAIEKHSGYSLRHGEAIAIGLVYVAHLALELGYISEDIALLHREMLHYLGLNLGYTSGRWDEIFELMSHDKKRKSNSIALILLKDLAKPERVEAIPNEIMKSVYMNSIAKG